MSKKKPSTKPRKRTKRKPNTRPPFLDRRAMERTMSGIGRLLSEREFQSPDEAEAFLQKMLASGALEAQPARIPVEQAQDLMYDAWEATGWRRVELARRALEISPDCADAYVLLAEEAARSLEEARDLYEQGVKAGERALGPRMFEEEVGSFWGLVETRPYMRARAGLAQSLWMLGERQQAIEHYTDMLRLNPGDNQGIRYLLAACLLEMGSDEALGKLLDQYEDDATAIWSYTRALWAFRRLGAGPEANASLRTALKQNRFVPQYLLGMKKLPRHLPEYIGFGDEDEAVAYVAEAGAGWWKTPGAMEWLAATPSSKSN